MKTPNLYSTTVLLAVVAFGLMLLGLNICIQAVGAVETDSIETSAAAIDPPVITFAPQVVEVNQSLNA